jgi:hypothetical protein
MKAAFAPADAAFLFAALPLLVLLLLLSSEI